MLTQLPMSRVPELTSAPAMRWGIIGPGGIAGAFTKGAHRHTGQRVVAVASRSAQRAQAFADEHGIPTVYDSYEQLVADPDVDIIYVATPHSSHLEHATLAMKAGKSVLVEKPMARNAAEAEQLVATAAENGVTLVEAMWTRFLPGSDIVRQLLADGALGDVHTVLADHGQYFAPDPQHRLHNPDLAGGALLDLGVYPTSFAAFALGHPERIAAHGRLTPLGVDESISAILTTGSADAVINTTLAAKTPTRASINGSQARVELAGPFYTPTEVTVVPRGGDALTFDGGPVRHSEGLAYEAAHTATLVAQGRQESDLLPWSESVAIMKTMDEMRRQVGVVYPGE